VIAAMKCGTTTSSVGRIFYLSEETKEKQEEYEEATPKGRENTKTTQRALNFVLMLIFIAYVCIYVCNK
jgi:hypothetical protein